MNQLVLSRRRASSLGQGLTEFALVLPVLLVILVTAIDFGRLFSAYVTIENAAKEGALFGASKPQCATSGPGCADPGNTTWHVDQDLSGLTGAATVITCVEAGTGTSKPPASCLSGDSYQVSVTYPFPFFTPLVSSIVGSPLPLTGTASSLVMNAAGPTTPVLSVAKTSTTTSITAVGEVVPYEYVITSTGNVSVTGIVVTDNNVDAPGVSCAATTLAPTASMTCTASRIVTDADVVAGASLTNIVQVTSTNAPTVSASLTIPIQIAPTCTAPTIDFTATPTEGSGLSVTVIFTGTSDGTPTSWVWDFGDGQQSSGSGLTSPNTVTHTYERNGRSGNLKFSPSLTVQTGSTCSTTETKNNYISLRP